MDGFTRRKEHSKEEIRRAAWELFSQFGVEKVSVADIARKAGVSQATIYNNFQSKDALAREFVAAVIDQLVTRVQAVLSPGKPFRDKMADLIRFISTIMAGARSSEVGLAALASRPDLRSDPEIKEIHDAARERMVSLLLGVIQEGRDQGQIPPDLSDEAYRLYFIAFMNMFTDLDLQPQFFSDPNLAGDLSTLMIYGLGGQRPR
jgi:AcrR family transcriptional regulator